jgi:hypothetical protein
MRKELKLHLANLLSAALLATLGALCLSYLLISFWFRDGFDLLEVVLLPITTGVFFLALTIPVSTVVLTKYVRECRSKNILSLKWGYQFLFLSLFIILAALIADGLIYWAGGSVISKAVAEGLMDFLQNQGKQINASSADMERFSHLPFFFQNIFANAFFIVLASLISALIVKFRMAPDNKKTAIAHGDVI